VDSGGAFTFDAVFADGVALWLFYLGFIVQRRSAGWTKRFSVIAMHVWIFAITLVALELTYYWNLDWAISVVVFGVAFIFVILGYRMQMRFARKRKASIPVKPQITVAETSADKAVNDVIAQGNIHILRLGELGETIQDIKIRRQIAHLQEIARQIFKVIAGQPEQLRKTNTFMDYYFPTTIKFLEKYAEFETKTIRGEHIQSSMEEIVKSMASIEKAFEHQLDNLFSEDALDISGDVAVMQSMMKQENWDKE
jgi:5-bromo-4-chloroindolyl phosphate hydrolysis protein